MSVLASQRLLLVGCGKMGSALLQGWLQQGIRAENVTIVEPAALSDALPESDLTQVSDAKELDGTAAFDVVVLAVKPQMMAEILPVYAQIRNSDGSGASPLYISIAAGTTIATFANSLGADAAIVRVMPNTPAAIGQGMSVLTANENVSERQKDIATQLMAAVGDTAWIASEAQMDAVTAVSGSGPAYVFHLIECLADAAVAVGLPAELGRQLAVQTVAGAGALAASAPESPGQLRVNVTSPGGTTAAALDVLMADNGLQPLVTAAVKAAEQRGRELGA